MSDTPSPRPHETRPIGRTPADQQRNAELLSGYDYDAYVESITGYTGQDLQRVGFVRWEPAGRVRIGPRGNYKAGFARLPDGTLVLTVCRDNNAPDPAARRFDIRIYASSDTGLTWEEIGQTPLFGKEPALASLPDGTLVLTAQCYPVSGDPPAHPLARSEDGGRTWDVSVRQAYDYPRSIAVEPDGSLLIATALRSDWYDEGFGSPHLLLERSPDGGRTWDRSEGRIDWDWPGFGEVGAVCLRDGRLLATLRRQIPGTRGEGFEDTMLTESTDGGRTWSTPWQLTDTAQVHAYLTELEDGRLLCTYSNYHVPFGVSAILSKDQGRSWNRDRTIQLSISNGFYVGWAATLQLPDGSLITSYAATTYAEQPPERFTCEIVRWPLPEDPSCRQLRTGKSL